MPSQVDWDAVYWEQLPRLYNFFRYRTGSRHFDLDSSKLNKTVNYVYVPPQPFADNLVQVGVPKFYADILAEMVFFLSRPVALPVADCLDKSLGCPCHRLKPPEWYR